MRSTFPASTEPSKQKSVRNATNEDAVRSSALYTTAMLRRILGGDPRTPFKGTIVDAKAMAELKFTAWYSHPSDLPPNRTPFLAMQEDTANVSVLKRDRS